MLVFLYPPLCPNQCPFSCKEMTDPDKVGIYQRLQETLGKIAKHKLALSIKEANFQQTLSLELLSGSGLRVSLLPLGFLLGQLPVDFFLQLSQFTCAHGCLGTTLIFSLAGPVFSVPVTRLIIPSWTRHPCLVTKVINLYESAGSTRK